MRYMRNSLFWLTLGIGSLLAGIASYYLFPQALSIVNISITMNRTQALDKAQELAFEHELGPEAYQQAVIFFTDNTVKTYTELDAGGKEQFDNLIAHNLFQPYQWIVRHFREHDPHEVSFYFTPDGKVYGFSEKLSENKPGATLYQQEAEVIARNVAQQWAIDLEPYALAESSQEKQPSGRIDHTFVFERTDQKLGDAPFRFTIIVAGDHVRELKHSVKVSEQFFQKYAEMRASNEGIASAAFFLMQFLYLGLCCIIGGLVLLKQRYLLYKTAIVVAFILSFLSVLMVINNLPLAWVYYQTSFSMHGFLLRSLVLIFYTFFYKFGMYALVFSVAESLTRKAFGNQPQLFTSVKSGAITSYQILQQIGIAYLIIPIFILYVLGFTIVTQTYLDWWAPSSILFDPNILATYFPWLNPLVESMNAGFLEECLFRAVPLATAALIGTRFGHRNWWIFGAFILQIFIFGAAHANYPMQPSYSRIIELIIPSIMFGLLYIRLGLLPGIICHTIYDVFWFSLPIFVSTAPGIWISKLIIILLCLLPIVIILYGYIKTGSFHELAQSYYNHAFKPQLADQKSRTPRLQTYITLPHGVYLFLLIVGFIGLYGFLQQPFQQDAHPLKTERAIAQEIATDRFAKQISKDRKSWVPLVSAQTSFLQEPSVKYQHVFVYQVGGKELYDQLMGTYLHAPYWQVRFVRFSGTFEQRAEEWWYFINKNRPFRKLHIVPEVMPGAHLTKEQAAEKVHAFIKKKFNIDVQDLEEVSAISQKHPNRTDWKFTYKDPRIDTLENGQAQTVVQLNGDVIGNYYQNIFVPEQWKREAQDKDNTLQVLMFLLSLLLYLLFSIGIALSLIQFTAEKHLIKKTVYLFLLFFGISLIMTINNWPTSMFIFNTSQPFSTQLFMHILQQFIRIIIQTLSIGLVITLASSWHTPTRLARTIYFYFVGIAIGLWFTGSSILVASCLKRGTPIWADYQSLGSYFPYVQQALTSIMSYLIVTSFILLISTMIDYLSVHWQKNRFLCCVFLIPIGFVLVALLQPQSVEHWLFIGITWSISLIVSYLIVIRLDLGIIPVITGTYFVMHQCVQAFYDPYTGSLFGIISAIILITIVSYYWSMQLNKSTASI